MAGRHFDGGGKPRLSEIASEICGYVGRLEIRVHGSHCDVVAPQGLAGNTVVASNVRVFNPDAGFRVLNIYVVGSQAACLPESYLSGEHDLDLAVLTNISKICSYPAELLILAAMSNILNNGGNSSREFSFDILDPTQRIALFPPYIQIYPEFEKVA
ncbi:hypothetical protein HYX10_05910 [Candidatus Woesearchaeota archaeon]|nr:hypothetical protein [Candidatus Woesearchaeota archaeon]